MTLLEQLTVTDASVVHELVTAYGRLRTKTVHAKFNNQPTWDNWGKSSSPFNNQPTWDNWNKKK
ncbi:multiple cyclophane-containing RiPP AmcA [Streptomyces orinoci]|uniref:Multiple cyclophane-containing RiPP AmcA n=1 Tax=Streptomyces orinoci TaxID=67339 RepID=A0ABV3JRR7_STRON|nr:multiple cyclophane-containing RiPP AmcA [Streptomyces orinoci]